jgi:tRNA U34 5-carboxymethylaminomethyl modifying GTPase MnmE/TrmE
MKDSEFTSNIEGFQYPITKNGKTTLKQIPPGLKHILIFGQARQGKSSLTNLVLDKEEAEVSDTVKGCTFVSEPFFNEKYCFWDTAGLDENDNGTVKSKEAIKNLIKLIKHTKGFHCCFLVVNWTNITLSSTKKNFEIFYKSLVEAKIPILFCITGKNLDEDMDEDYFKKWMKKQDLVSLGFSGIKSRVIFSKSLSKIKQSQANEYQKARKYSREKIISYLDTIPNNAYVYYKKPNIFVKILQNIWNPIVSFFKLPVNWMINTSTKIIDFLMKKMDFTEKEIKELEIDKI